MWMVAHMLVFFNKNRLEKKIDKLLKIFSRKEFVDFLEIMIDTKKIFWRSFIMGIAKGIGAAIGFSVLGAIIIYLLKCLVTLNIPIIGQLLSDIIKATEESMK